MKAFFCWLVDVVGAELAAGGVVWGAGVGVGVATGVGVGVGGFAAGGVTVTAGGGVGVTVAGCPYMATTTVFSPP